MKSIFHGGNASSKFYGWSQGRCQGVAHSAILSPGLPVREGEDAGLGGRARAPRKITWLLPLRWGSPLTLFLSDGHDSPNSLVPAAIRRRSSQLDAVSHAVYSHPSSSLCGKRAPARRSSREPSVPDHRYSNLYGIAWCRTCIQSCPSPLFPFALD